MADELGIMVTELPEATNIGDDDLFYLVQESYSKKTKTRSLKNSILGNVLGTASGQPATFPDGSDNPLEACNVDITPVQDLHGYDKPWAGGAGKNLLNDSTVDIGTYSGVTVSKNSKGQFILNGTATANNSVNVGSCTLPAGSYSLNGMTTIGTANTFFLNIAPTWSGSNNFNLYSGDYNGTPIKERSYIVRIYWRNGTVFNNTVFEPMIRKSTDSDTFEPYSNICPISGHSSVTVTVSDGETSTTKTTALGQTVYGGQLNVLTGELTIDRVYLKLTSDLFTAFNNTLKAGFTDGNYLGQHIMACNALAPSYSYSTVTDTISVRTQDGRIIAVPSWASECTDLASFKTAYANQTELEVVHTITPQTVQLTPREVNSLLGQNNISADTGDITVVYVRDLNSCISNIISRIEALEQANSNRSLSLNRGLAKSVEEPQEVKEEPLEEEVKEEEQEEVNER